MLPLLAYDIAGNSIALLFASLCIGLGLWIAFHLAVRIGSLQLEKIAAKHEGVATIAHVLKRIPFWVLAVLAFSIALRLLRLPAFVDRMLYALLVITFVTLGIIIAQRIAERVLWRAVPRFRSDGEELPAVVHFTVSLLLWILGALLILSNLGVNVISLVAGLGIGGVAIALATQNILSDIFSSFSLYFDQPFKEGDFIIVGQHMGTVKKIGIKTTRLEALQGEEIIIPNKELTESRVQNFKRMQQRRIEFRFGLSYDTPPEKLRQVPQALKQIVESKKPVRFDRAHVKGFTAMSLECEVVYFVLSTDYNEYMDIQQEMNFEIIEKLRELGVQFAVPKNLVAVQ